jgi:flagella basal body P-ring formation protein FlgA
MLTYEQKVALWESEGMTRSDAQGLVDAEELQGKITVRNLMSGRPVQIDRDTPWSCNPASETYWTM